VRVAAAPAAARILSSIGLFGSPPLDLDFLSHVTSVSNFSATV
jgi:hypothetical protein